MTSAIVKPQHQCFASNIKPQGVSINHRDNFKLKKKEHAAFGYSLPQCAL